MIFSTDTCVLAENNPTSVSNNKFGIHISNENELKDAADLVNSSGGDWGYVTFVITEAERNHDRWQQTFDQMRSLHLIPIVRIATKMNGDSWDIPNDAEMNNWIAFLNSLNWVIQDRYVIIGNEPNHSKEWGGKIDPAGYSTYLSAFAQKFHHASGDFFVLPAGLDASAKNTKDTMDETVFIKKMLGSEPALFDNLDGWTSHSYPNPDFAGAVTDTGRGSVYTFDWELNYLRSLEITKDLPVFITETGWSNQKVDPAKIGEMYDYAFKNVWNDKRVVAVTPFILNYPESPFSEFSWKKKDGSVYPYYDMYKNIPKVEGSPIQIESGQILGALAQPILLKESDFVGAILAKNTGQSIWNANNLKVVSDDGSLIFKNNLLFDIEPTRTGLVVFRASTAQNRGILLKSVYLADEKDKRITNSFSIEGLIVKADKVQIQTFFARISGYLRSIVNQGR
jgi:hypothetical protein